MGRNIEITNEDLMEALWDYAAENREVPHSKAFRGCEKYPSVTLYERRYGSFGAAARLAGFRPNAGGRREYWDEELVVSAIRAWALVNKRLPESSDMGDDELLPSPNVVRRLFDDLDAARYRAVSPGEIDLR